MKKYIFLLGFLALAAIGVGFYMYNKPHENIKKAKADHTISAEDLFAEYEKSEDAANTKYLDKVIQIRGTVSGVKTDDNGIVNVTLNSGGMFGVICTLDEHAKHKRTDFKKGDKVTFKGKCTGMLMDVVLARCVEM